MELLFHIHTKDNYHLLLSYFIGVNNSEQSITKRSKSNFFPKFDYLFRYRIIYFAIKVSSIVWRVLFRLLSKNLSYILIAFFITNGLVRNSVSCYLDLVRYI